MLQKQSWLFAAAELGNPVGFSSHDEFQRRDVICTPQGEFVCFADPASMFKAILGIWLEAGRGSNITGQGMYGWLVDNGYLSLIEDILLATPASEHLSPNPTLIEPLRRLHVEAAKQDNRLSVEVLHPDSTS